MLVKNRQTFTVLELIGLSDTFTQDIDIPFPADELRIVQIVHSVSLGDDIVNVVSWEGVGDLFMFDNSNSSVNVDIRINVKGKCIRGTQTFKIRTDDGPQDELVGVLGFIFEAIQH